MGAAAVWCGRCRACRKGLVSACESGAIFGNGPLFGDLDGAQADYVRVPFADMTLQPIPAGSPTSGSSSPATSSHRLFGGGRSRPRRPGSARRRQRRGLRRRPGGALRGGFGAAVPPGPHHRGRPGAHTASQMARRPGRRPGRSTPPPRTCAGPVKEAHGRLGRRLRHRGRRQGGEPRNAVAVAAPGGVVSVVGVFQHPVSVNAPRMLAKNLTIDHGDGRPGPYEGARRSDRSGQARPDSLDHPPHDLSTRSFAPTRSSRSALDGAIKVLLRPPRRKGERWRRTSWKRGCGNWRRGRRLEGTVKELTGRVRVTEDNNEIQQLQ